MLREEKPVNELNTIKKSYAYIIYRPEIKEEKNRVFISEEAKTVFFPPLPEGEKVSMPDISTLCAKWKKNMDQMEKEIKTRPEEGDQWKGHIDILQSWRRKYMRPLKKSSFGLPEFSC